MRAVSGILLVTILCALGMGCGQAVGSGHDAAQTDAAVPPGCEVPAQQTVISSGQGPTVVHGVDRLPDGNYLVGATEGEAGSAATGLYVVDGNTLQILSFSPVDQDVVIARYDEYGDSILAVGTQGDAAFLHWLSYSNGQVSEIQDSTPLCSGCAVSWSLPAAGDPQDASPLGLAVAVEYVDSPATPELQVFLVDRWSPGVARATARIPGAQPTLATGHWGYVLMYTAPSGSLTSRVVQVEGTMWAERELVASPMPGRSNASVTSRVETINAVEMDSDALAGDTPPETGLVAMELSAEGVVVTRRPYEEVTQSARDFWLSAANDLFAVTWVDTSAESVAGAWFFILRALTLNRVCGPVRVGGDLSPPVGQQQLRAVSAPHPEGYVVLWSVAQDDAGDGLFGKIIPVTP